jgi:hypothetical protein
VIYRCVIKLQPAADRLAIGDGLESRVAGRQPGFTAAHPPELCRARRHRPGIIRTRLDGDERASPASF